MVLVPINISTFCIAYKLLQQGRRRVFKSGPAEEIIECRRHVRGESTRGGRAREGGEHERGTPPLSRGGGGGVGGLPRENFEFLALLCAF